MAPRQIRPIRVEGNIAYIPLTRGYEAIIDAADVPLVEGHNWFAHKRTRKFYAATNMRQGDRYVTVQLHTMITGFAITDHRDGDGLNNRRENLREANAFENARNRRLNQNNTSGYKGVAWRAQSSRWSASIRFERRLIHLGYFDTPEDAAAAYAKASAEMHGEFGRIA